MFRLKEKSNTIRTNMKKEFQGLEEGPKTKIHFDSLRTKLKLKTLTYDGVHGFWFNKFTSNHDRQIIEMNRC